MNHSLAVLITYHNEQHLLTRCLDSLLSQDDKPDEIWIYDDASAHSARNYVPAVLRSCIIRGARNKGPAHGRNQLLAATACTFVHFHDADDWFFPGWCTTVRTAMSSNIDALFTECSSFRSGTLTTQQVIGLTNRISASDDLIRFAIRHALLVPSGTYRRTLIETLGGYREQIWQSEDWDFHVRVALARPRFAIIEQPYVGIDVRPSSRSQQRAEVWSSQLDSIGLLQNEAPPEFQDDLAEAAAHASSELFQLGLHAEAARGFRQAVSLGKPVFEGRPASYRVLASIFSPLFAEKVADSYRRLLPIRLRNMMRRSFSNVAAT